MSASSFPIAAVVSSESDVADKLLAEFASRMRRQGWRVCGLVQQSRRSAGKGKQMTLTDLNDPACCFPISQDLGAGSSACSLDPAGVAAAGVVLRDALRQKPDLAIANRFGVLEASGRGLIDELLALMGERTPLLIIVAERYLDAWRAFTGGEGVELPPRIEALEAWFKECRRSVGRVEPVDPRRLARGAPDGSGAAR
ncbi:MAG TPA: DUF2478 domain-containing protein [Steroidobacter sp.]|jgi:hypothetical protein|nr:DUF2478 domain-containing protein [Steroidobacteraceae bacterium]HLS82817.1 DUF2478 domain-containing protein [Steroidobacter sp.]